MPHCHFWSIQHPASLLNKKISYWPLSLELWTVRREERGNLFSVTLQTKRTFKINGNFHVLYLFQTLRIWRQVHLQTLQDILHPVRHRHQHLHPSSLAPLRSIPRSSSSSTRWPPLTGDFTNITETPNSKQERVTQACLMTTMTILQFPEDWMEKSAHAAQKRLYTWTTGMNLVNGNLDPLAPGRPEWRALGSDRKCLKRPLMDWSLPLEGDTKTKTLCTSRTGKQERPDLVSQEVAVTNTRETRQQNLSGLPYRLRKSPRAEPLTERTIEDETGLEGKRKTGVPL